MHRRFQLFNKPLQKLDEARFGRGRDWNVDLVPKLIMANGTRAPAAAGRAIAQRPPDTAAPWARRQARWSRCSS